MTFGEIMGNKIVVTVTLQGEWNIELSRFRQGIYL